MKNKRSKYIKRARALVAKVLAPNNPQFEISVERLADKLEKMDATKKRT